MEKGTRPTDVPEISVKEFHIAMDNFQRYQFIVGVSNLCNEEKRSIAAVNDLKNTVHPKSELLIIAC